MVLESCRIFLFMTLPHFPKLLSVVRNVIKNTLQSVLQMSGYKLAKYHFAKNVKLNVQLSKSSLFVYIT